MRTLCMHTDTIFYVWECSWPFLPLKRTQYLSRKMNKLNKVNIVNMIFCFRYPSEHSVQHSRRFGTLQSWLLWALLPEIFSASGGLSLIFLCDILKCKAQQRLAGKQQYRPWVLDDLWICELWNNNEVKKQGYRWWRGTWVHKWCTSHACGSSKCRSLMDVHGKRVSVEWCGMPLVIQWLCPERQNSGCTTYGWQTYIII
jgi:hypothetical protein